MKIYSMEGCNNKAKVRGICVRHGATENRKRCSKDGWYLSSHLGRSLQVARREG